MLKATLLTSACGLLFAKLRWPYALSGLLLLTGGEIAHLVMHHSHSALHFAADFTALDTVGQLTWLISAVWLVL